MYELVVKSVVVLLSYLLFLLSEFGKSFVEVKVVLLIVCGAYYEASVFILEIEMFGLFKEGWVFEFIFLVLLGKGDLYVVCEYVKSVLECDVDEEVIEMARTMFKGKEDGNKMFNVEKYVEVVVFYIFVFDVGKVLVVVVYCLIVFGNCVVVY